MRVFLKFDGSCTNTKYDGDLGAGFHAYYEDGTEIFRKSLSTGIGTNNEAEYLSLICALRELQSRNLTRNITVMGDSKITITQVKGEAHCRSDNLRRLLREVRRLQLEFDSLDFLHIPREQNYLADELAKAGVKRTIKKYYNYRF